MKKLDVLFVLTLAILITACASRSEKAADKNEVAIETEAEIPLPEGYPEELSLPQGFNAGDISQGDGAISGGGKGLTTFHLFTIERMGIQNQSELIEHYKKISEQYEWEGEWNIAEDGLAANGKFIKGNMEMEVKVNDMIFSFSVRVFNE